MLLQCKNIPSHFSHFHSQMTSALSSIIILITSSQLELKHPLCKKLQHSLNCSISQMEFPPHHLKPLCRMRAPLINPTFIRSGQSSIPCSRDIVEPYTIPIITIPHSSISQVEWNTQLFNPNWPTCLLSTFGHIALHNSYRPFIMFNCTIQWNPTYFSLYFHPHWQSMLALVIFTPFYYSISSYQGLPYLLSACCNFIALL